MIRFFIYTFLAIMPMAARAGGEPQAESPSHAKAAKLTEEQVVKKYSYWQMQEVANYLMAIIERSPAPKGKKPAKILKCDPKPERAQDLMSGEVHALVDATRKPALEAYKKDPASYAPKVKSCSERCECSSYGLLFEDVEDPLVSSEAHKANKAALDEEVKKESPAQNLKCAQKTKWFCKSDLKKYLF